MEARQATDHDVRSLATTPARAFHDDQVVRLLSVAQPGPPARPMWRGPW